MIKKPLISILMNCFNGESYLEEALNSVLQQEYKNWELIFWDNNSTDRSKEIVSSFKDKRIRIFTSLFHTNLGKARKEAYKKVQGDYLAFLDVDDIWKPNKLMEQINLFDDEEVGITYTNAIYFSKKKKKNLYKSSINLGINTKKLITNYPLSLNSIMINISKLNKLEYNFDENYSNICDFDLIVRLSATSKVKYLDKILSGWRIHGNNESFKKKELFNQEKEKWCDYHLSNEYLIKFQDSIKELKLLILAEKRIFKYGFDLKNFKSLNLSKISNTRNKLYILFSYIPFIPKLLYITKDFIFKKVWY
jgi:glycosyltransferase involved in cell wall biosynthesis